MELELFKLYTCIITVFRICSLFYSCWSIFTGGYLQTFEPIGIQLQCPEYVAAAACWLLIGNSFLSLLSWSQFTRAAGSTHVCGPAGANLDLKILYTGACECEIANSKAWIQIEHWHWVSCIFVFGEFVVCRLPEKFEKSKLQVTFRDGRARA